MPIVINRPEPLLLWVGMDPLASKCHRHCRHHHHHHHIDKFPRVTRYTRVRLLRHTFGDTVQLYCVIIEHGARKLDGG